MRLRPKAQRARGTLLLLLGLAIPLAACSDPAPAVDNRIAVKTVVVGGDGQAAAGDSARYAGSIASSFESDLAFRVPGRITARRAGLGDRVGAGAVLATLDPAPLRLAARSADAAVAAGRAELVQAESELARNAPLAAERIVAPAQIDRLRAARDGARARLLDAQARAAAARDDLGYAALRSPTDGVVTQVSAEVGQYLTPGQVAFRVARPDRLDVVVDVPESVVASLRPGAPAIVRLIASQQPVRGRIREVSPAADPATRTYRVKVSLGATGAARIGMTAQVGFPSAAEPATASGTGTGTARDASFILPMSAVAQAGRRPAVWVVKPNGTLELRPVTLASFTDTGANVTAGVRRGERIVAAGVHRLDRGQRVKLWDGRLP